MYSNTDGYARLAEDTLTLADELQVPGQVFHDIKYYRSVQVERWGGLFDGALGLAIDGFWFPGSIEGPNILPSPFRTMVDNHFLDVNIFSIAWPSGTQEEGSLIFGGYDEDLLDGGLTPLPLFPEGTTKWQVEIESVTIIVDNDSGGKEALLHEPLPGYAAMTISTMPFILFPEPVAESLLRQLVKWSPSRCATFVVVDCDVVPSLPEIIIGLKGQNVTLRGEDYVQRRAYPMWFCDDDNRTKDGCVVMISGIFGPQDPLENTVILGTPFLKHFMGVWNWDDRTISCKLPLSNTI